MAFLLQHLLEEGALLYPDKDAVRYESQGITYGHLDCITNIIASLLQEAGLSRGDRVGIFLHKSLASIMSIFGILKAGGVYVPLDTGSPARRLRYVLGKTQTRILMISSELLLATAELLCDETPVETIVLMDNDHPIDVSLPDRITIIPWERINSRKESTPNNPATIETDLAYILFTSGSTGEPKGVMISHRTIFTFINWCHSIFKLNKNDRITSHAPLHFDLSTFDVFSTIKAGGTIIQVPEKLSIFPSRLAQLIQEERITVTYLVPSILTMMVTYGNLDRFDLSSLRYVLFAGEVFPIKYLRKLAEAIPQAGLFNLYGPTETNVCTYYRVRKEDLDPTRNHPLPIGIACENTEVFAVDDKGNKIEKPGQEGELWVRGSCVAQGYWKDPEHTDRSFVRNSFQPHFNETVFKTGDIVTLSKENKNWIFIGRKDHMIKSCGYRIELGEIETALLSHASVKEAAAVAISDQIVGNRIRAYVVANEDSKLLPRQLQDYCSQHLPRYMVPEAIVILNMLPKTSSGKIDRDLLKKNTEESQHEL